MIFAIGSLQASQAEKSHSQCSTTKAAISLTPATNIQDQTIISADRLIKKGTVTTLEGQVTIRQKQRRIHADQLIMQKQGSDRNLHFSGNVLLTDKNTLIHAETLNTRQKNRKTQILHARFQEKGSALRGYAKSLQKPSEKLSILSDSYFTSCPENNELWRLKSQKIKLDYDKNLGIAENIVMEYSDIPFFYSPFFFFPLSKDRQSGFLIPAFEQSSRNGLEMTVPYYFNIAPNMDDTLSARIMEKSGLFINNEFRLLTANSRWTLNSEFLSTDQINQKQRSLFKLKQAARIGKVAINMDITTASDKDYFADFGNSLSVTNLSHLQQNIQLSTPIDGNNLKVNFLSYQTLDNNIAASARPYQLLPKIEYRNNLAIADMQIPFDSEFSSFYRINSVTGQRFHFRPGIEQTFTGTAWYIKPRLSLDSTYYRLQGNGSNNILKRNLPVFSLDSKIFLEKPISLNRMQTLEPRFFYLWIPYQDQNNFPLFDSARNTFSFEQLYRENLFSGLDRIQNANQLSTAISFKEINPQSGKTRYQIQSGIIHYFENNKVLLPTETFKQQPGSNLLLQWDGYFPQKTQAQLFLQYDPFGKNWIKQTAFIRYHNQDKIINFSWNKNLSDELLGLSAYLPLANHWQGIARYDYSARKKKEIISLLGIEFNNCCFQFRMAYNRGLNVSNNLYNEKTTFELVFKGLSQPASGIGAKWQDNIIGYRDPYQSY